MSYIFKIITAIYPLQSKKDLEKAEEYYSRAILMDPGDGEILSQYAQLIWELHGDDERALSYFQRAVQVSPENRLVFNPTSDFSLHKYFC